MFIIVFIINPVFFKRPFTWFIHIKCHVLIKYYLQLATFWFKSDHRRLLMFIHYQLSMLDSFLYSVLQTRFSQYQIYWVLNVLVSVLFCINQCWICFPPGLTSLLVMKTLKCQYIFTWIFQMVIACSAAEKSRKHVKGVCGVLGGGGGGVRGCGGTVVKPSSCTPYN